MSAALNPNRLQPMKKAMFKLSTVLVLFTLVSACSIKMLPDQWSLPPKAEDEVSVMHFNVENLFDTQDDPDRSDETYLPRSQKNTPEHRALCAKVDSPFRRQECLELDYSEKLVKKKMGNIAQIILGVDGKGPDVVVFVEVENERILKRLNEEFLGPAGYKTLVLIEGPDKRGIDLGLLSRLPLAGKAQLHKPKIETDEDQSRAEGMRGILDVPLKLPNGDTLHVMGAHFPSQANPRPWREQMLKQLVKLVESKGEKALVVAGGDLNITAEEEEEAKLFKKNAAPAVAVSHFVGCKKCPGTHSYRKRWSFLDVQLYSKALQSEGSGSYKLLPESIDVIRYNDLHIQRGKYPLRWDSEKLEGVSDHFPIYSRIKLRNPSTEAQPIKKAN